MSNLVYVIACLSIFLITGCTPRIASLKGSEKNVTATLNKPVKKRKSYSLHSTTKGKLSTTSTTRTRVSFELPREPGDLGCLYIKDQEGRLTSFNGIDSSFGFKHAYRDKKQKLSSEIAGLQLEINKLERSIRLRSQRTAQQQTQLSLSYAYRSGTCRVPTAASIRTPPKLACAPNEVTEKSTGLCVMTWGGPELCDQIIDELGRKLDTRTYNFLNGPACTIVVSKLIDQGITGDDLLLAFGLGISDDISESLMKEENVFSQLLGLFIKGATVTYKFQKFNECTRESRIRCSKLYTNWNSAYTMYQQNPASLKQQCEETLIEIASEKEQRTQEQQRLRELQKQYVEKRKELSTLRRNRSIDLKPHVCAIPKRLNIKNPAWTNLKRVTLRASLPLSVGFALREQSGDLYNDATWTPAGDEIPISGRVTVLLTKNPSIYVLGAYDKTGGIRIIENDVFRPIGDPRFEMEYIGGGIGVYSGIRKDLGYYLEGGLAGGKESLSFENDTIFESEVTPSISSWSAKPFIETGLLFGSQVKGHVGLSYLYHGIKIDGVPAETEIPLPDGLFFIKVGIVLDAF